MTTHRTIEDAMTAEQEYHRSYAREIGVNVYEQHRGPQVEARRCRCYSYWTDCVDALGFDAAVAEAQAGHTAAMQATEEEK